MIWDPANCPAEWLKDKNVVVGPKGELHPYWGMGLHSPDVNWALGTPERMKKLAGLIEEAKRRVKTPEEKIRLQRFIDGIWTNTLEGEREYRLDKAKKSKLPYRLQVTPSENGNGDWSKVDWSKSVKTGTWQNLYGKPAERNCHAELAADSEYLYLKLFDDSPAEKVLNFWREDFEILFHDGNGYPVYHLAVGPDGTFYQYKHILKDGKDTVETYDFGAKIISRSTDESWTVLMAIPLNKLPLKGSRMSLNFMRTTPSGNAAWNPIFTDAYIKGIDRFGVLHIQP